MGAGSARRFRKGDVVRWDKTLYLLVELAVHRNGYPRGKTRHELHMVNLVHGSQPINLAGRPNVEYIGPMQSILDNAQAAVAFFDGLRDLMASVGEVQL